MGLFPFWDLPEDVRERDSPGFAREQKSDSEWKPGIDEPHTLYQGLF